MSASGDDELVDAHSLFARRHNKSMTLTITTLTRCYRFYAFAQTDRNPSILCKDTLKYSYNIFTVIAHRKNTHIVFGLERDAMRLKSFEDTFWGKRFERRRKKI